MYELLQRVYKAVTSFPSFFWPWDNNRNSTKRTRCEVVDLSSEDEDVILVSTKKLKLHNSIVQDGVCHVKNSKTQTDNTKRKQLLKQQWQYELSKENWDLPEEVIDLVEDTPNKFKNQYRPPRHVRSPYRIGRKTLSDNTKENIKELNEKRGSHPNSCNQFFSGENTKQILERKNLSKKMANGLYDHDEYSMLLNTFINKSNNEASANKVATVSPIPTIKIDLTNDSDDDNASTSQSHKEFKNSKGHLKLFEGGTSSVKKNQQPRRMRVKLRKKNVDVHNITSLSIRIDDDNDDDEEHDAVEFIKTPPVARVNSLENKIKSESNVANEQWISHLLKSYEAKRLEMEEMTKKLAMELTITKENQRSDANELALKLLTRHLQITESIYDEEEIIEPELPSLTVEMKDAISKASRKHPAEEVLIEKFNYRIKRNDINTLTGLNWLNDEIINFYISLIMERSKEKTILPKTYSFNTFFYLRLANSGYQGVKRWTKKVDIFAHDLIIIPVHLKMHWCLAVIDCENKTINYYDSMGTTNDQCLKRLEDYLVSEHKDKKGENLSMENWTMNNVKDIPKQRNGSDCGVFSCTFAEFLSRRAKFTFDQNDMPLIRNKMIYEIISGKLLT